MPNIRQQLEVLRDEARDFFAHAEGKGNTEDPIRLKVAGVMAEVASVIKGALLLGPTALSSHQRNARRMASALRMKRYECWDQYITYDEDIPIGRTQAGEEEYTVSVGEAEVIFLEALDNTVALLDLAAPTTTASGTAHESQHVQDGHGLMEEAVLRPPAPGGPRAPDLERLLQGKKDVGIVTAAQYLERSRGHVQRLVRKGVLVRVGQQRPLKISVESLRRRKLGTALDSSKNTSA